MRKQSTSQPDRQVFFVDRVIGIVGGILCLIAVTGACSNETGGTSNEPSGATDDDSSSKKSFGDPNVLVGAFLIKAEAPIDGSDGCTTVAGRVSDGPSPELVVWEKGQVVGDCQLYTPRIPICEPPCKSTFACVEDDTCQAYPTAQDVGKVTMKGLKTTEGEDEFSMKFVANNYQSPTLPYPAFEEGDDISLSAAGSEFTGAFSLTVKGIDSLELLNESIVIEDKDLVLTWSKPTKSDISKIYVKLDISFHAGSNGKIECLTDDTGELTIAGSLLEDLVALGAAGYPTIVVARRATEYATISAGRVDLIISNEVERSVTIPGLISCNKDEECPTGQLCQKDLKCE